jgi:hypothetical protein
VSRTQDFGSFGVGLPQQEVLKSVPKFEISTGLFGAATEEYAIHVPDYVLEWIKDGDITFTVADTNGYGNMVIEWNGDEIYSENAKAGAHRVDLQASQIKSENALKVYAHGPFFLFFWAATTYDIRNFNLNAEYGPAKFLEFEVSQDELESLDKFDLAWYTTSRRGSLIVKVNAEEIYNAVPERQESVEFTDISPVNLGIRPGKNRLTFLAMNGSFELDDVIMNTYVSKNQRVVKERFELNGEQINRIKASGGLVKIYVKYIDKTGNLNVKINERSLDSSFAESGWNRFSFNDNYVETGSNWIEISGTGTFDVSDVNVGIA